MDKGGDSVTEYYNPGEIFEEWVSWAGYLPKS